MIQKALGLIETVGLTAATEAADAAVKSANVRLIGYENTRGGGLITIKVEGDVGAVNAAVAAAKMAASKVGTVVTTLVIPRPAANLEKMIYSGDTVGLAKPQEPPQQLEEKPQPEPAAHVEATVEPTVQAQQEEKQSVQPEPGTKAAEIAKPAPDTAEKAKPAPKAAKKKTAK